MNNINFSHFGIFKIPNFVVFYPMQKYIVSYKGFIRKSGEGIKIL